MDTKSVGRGDQALAFFRASMEEFYAHCRVGGIRLHSNVKLLREDGEFHCKVDLTREVKIFLVFDLAVPMINDTFWGNTFGTDFAAISLQAVIY